MNTANTASSWRIPPNAAQVTVWWTPDCGHQHVAVNPPTIPLACPDGFKKGDDHPLHTEEPTP